MEKTKHIDVYLKWLSLIMIGISLVTCIKSHKAENIKVVPGIPENKINVLQKKYLNYDEILTLDDILLHLELDGNKVEKIGSDSLGTDESCFYIWASDRPDVVSEKSVMLKFSDNNQIGIKELISYNEKFTASELVEIFEFSFKQLTDKDIGIISRKIEKELSGKSKQNKADLESLINARKGSGYEKIYEIGESAFWKFDKDKGGDLVVLSGNESFTLNVKINHNPEENLNLAKKLAKTIIDKSAVEI